MEEEVCGLVSVLEDKKTIKRASLTFYEGTIHNKNVVIVECGIAKVNAAMCAQILISEFNVDTLINTGVAGGLYHELDINDIVISIDAIEYDVDASPMGDPVGTIPRMKTSVFVADKKLVETAYQAILDENTEYKAFKGRVVTGDKFVADKTTKEFLVSEFGGYCCEMEGGAIAHVAYCNEIPFVVIRAISDNAESKASKTYGEFVEIAAITSKEMVLRMLKKL